MGNFLDKLALIVLAAMAVMSIVLPIVSSTRAKTFKPEEKTLQVICYFVIANVNAVTFVIIIIPKTIPQVRVMNTTLRDWRILGTLGRIFLTVFAGHVILMDPDISTHGALSGIVMAITSCLGTMAFKDTWMDITSAISLYLAPAVIESVHARRPIITIVAVAAPILLVIIATALFMFSEPVKYIYELRSGNSWVELDNQQLASANQDTERVGE